MGTQGVCPTLAAMGARSSTHGLVASSLTLLAQVAPTQRRDGGGPTQVREMREEYVDGEEDKN
jgi:hypothetical protein